jgi:hypothetical protein
MFSRRQFVVWAAGAIPVALVTRRADALGTAWVAGELETLSAIAQAVLPSDVSTRGAERVARAFLDWMNGYAANVELVHGYGTSALRISRASPRPNWAAQLEKLGPRVTGKSVDERRAVLRDELKNERLDRMPSVSTAPHVAVALLSFYYSSPDAADLCYEAGIGRTMCRSLASSSRKPLPLGGGARS